MAVSEIPQLLYQGSDIPIQGSTLRPGDKSVCHDTLDGYHSNSSAEEISHSVSIFGRLVGQKSNSGRYPQRSAVHHQADFISRTNNQRKEVRFNSCPEFCFYRDGISDSQEHSSSAMGQSTRHSESCTLVQETRTSISKTIPVSSGEVKCSCSICCFGQATLMSSSNGSFCSVEASCSTIRALHFDQYANQESFGEVEHQRKVCPGCTSETTPAISHSFHRRQSLRMGCPSGTGGTSVSWCLISGPISATHQCLRDERHSVSFKTVSSTCQQYHSHDSHGQFISGSLFEEAGGYPLSFSLHGGWETLRWCDKRNINLLVRHEPGKSNILADRLSRLSKPISTEWCLDQAVCNLVLSVTGYPNIDLFATRLNNRLPVYVSPIPDDRALAIDALSMNWDRIHAYAFPPFALIPAIISKIRQHQCKIVLVAPFWPEATWFPELLRLLVAPPIRLPVKQHLLTQLQFVRNNIENLRLHVWILCANQSEIEAFWRKLPNTPLKLDKFLLEKSMISNGTFSPVGVVSEIDPVMASPGNVADYLLHMFQEKKCQVSTVKGYRSTISNTLKFKSGQNIGSDPIISELIKYMELQRPVQRSLAPNWDLSCVLSSLCGEPFEPLNRAGVFSKKINYHPFVLMIFWFKI